jgi:hypothetical protein
MSKLKSAITGLIAPLKSSKSQIFVGVNITSNELTEQLFLDNKLPKNYQVRTYPNRKDFETMLKMSKPTILQIRDINGISSFNPYLQTANEDDIFVELVVIRKFPNKS